MNVYPTQKNCPKKGSENRASMVSPFSAPKSVSFPLRLGNSEGTATVDASDCQEFTASGPQRSRPPPSFPLSWDYPNSWLVYFMENPMKIP